MEINVQNLQDEAARRIIGEIYRESSIESLIELLPKDALIGNILSIALTEILCESYELPLPQGIFDRKLDNHAAFAKKMVKDVNDLMETIVCENLRDEIGALKRSQA